MNQLAIKQSQKLRRAIMRRVWYAYGLSVVLSRAALQGFLFGASMIGFWKFASVMSIINNVLAIRVGELPAHIVQSIMQGHVLVLLSFGIMVFSALSFGIHIKLPRYTWSGHQVQST